VQWKGFIVEYDSWKKKEDLENAKKLVAEFQRRMNANIRKKKLDLAEEKDFKKAELPGNYMAKVLYG